MSVKQIGTKFTSTYKSYLTTPSGKPMSWFHDVPLFNKEKNTMNMVLEIPRWTNGKFEISSEPYNPITQDIKKNKPRFVSNLFPYHGYIHNYGCLPQTWEDPTQLSHGYLGDNDPIDVCEIGNRVGKLGDINEVKVLGSLAMIDSGEMDWKVIAISVEDPLSDKLNSIGDVEKLMPGYLTATRNWFRDYKKPQGKPANEFAFDGEYQDLETTLAVINDTHLAWKQLVAGRVTGDKIPSIVNSTLVGTPGYAESPSPIVGELTGPAEIPKEVDTVYYL